jgi:hypothetical protein
MLGGGMLRDEGSPAFEREHGRFGGDLTQCLRRKSLKKRNLDYLFNGSHTRIIIYEPYRRAGKLRYAQRIVWNAIYVQY